MQTTDQRNARAAASARKTLAAFEADDFTEHDAAYWAGYLAAGLKILCDTVADDWADRS